MPTMATQQSGHFNHQAPRCERLPAGLAYTAASCRILLDEHCEEISPLHVETRTEYEVIRVLQTGVFGIHRAQEGMDTLSYCGLFRVVGLKFLSFPERAPHRHSARSLR